MVPHDNLPWIVISPHPDDAVLSCGGTLARRTADGYSSSVITIFSAIPDATGSRSPVFEEIFGPSDAVSFADERRREDAEACAALGVDLDLLGFRDAMFRRGDSGRWLYNDCAALEGPVNDADAGLKGAILAALAPAIPPAGHAVLLAPAAIGGHVDHRLVHESARRLADHGHLVRYYEDYPYSIANEVFGRRRTPDVTDAPRVGYSDEVVVLKEVHMRAKIAALRCYRSQIGVLFGDAAQMETAVRASARAVGGDRFGERRWLATAQSRSGTDGFL